MLNLRSKIFILGILILITVTGLIFIRNHWPEKIINPFATVKDTFQNLINQYSPKETPANIPEIATSSTEESKETEKSESPETGVELEESESSQELTLDDITEEIDDISERVDSLSQKVAALFPERIPPEKEESEKNIKEPENKEEPEEKEKEIKEKEIKEEAEAKEKIEKEMIVYCSKIEADPARNKIIFNEISWMGNINSANDEWLELKNISSENINLSGWQILDKEDQIKIIFESRDIISAGQFYLLERTNDDSVPNIAADKIYTGSLNDTDEVLYFFDSNCQLQDIVSADPDWPAGDKIYWRSMERKRDLNWQTSLNAGGTPKAENSSGYIVLTPSDGGGGGLPSAPSYPKILISEIQISPIEQRFIELYNPTDYEVNLTDWYIQRKTKTGTSWTSLVSSTRFEEKTIPSRSYFLITRSIIENYDILLEGLTLTEDNAILLKNPNREIVEIIGWGQPPDFETTPALNPSLGKSLGRKWDEINQTYFDRDDNSVDFEIQDPTPKTRNQNFVLPPLPEDVTPPQVSFDAVSSLQLNLSFSLSWSGEDLALGEATPSGIDGFSISYTTTPSDIDGIDLQYQTEDGAWQDWLGNEILELEENKSSLSLLGEDERIYTFQIKAKDKNGNESNWIGTTIEINTLPVVINEIAWMGNLPREGETVAQAANNEWIELYSNASLPIDLTNWVLKSADGTPEIQLAGVIFPSQFYLLERTDDDSVPNIAADKIYTGALGNSGEDFQFFDKFSNLIDRTNCSGGWFGGDNTTKQTMERKSPRLSGDDANNWGTSQETGGTPKNQNSIYIP
jgi:hypothetical protein